MEDSDQDWVKPFISALTVAHCSAIFPEVLPHVQRLCPEVWSGTRDRAFIYALSADETSSALVTTSWKHSSVFLPLHIPLLSSIAMAF